MFDEKVSIIIPYKSEVGQRNINFEWIKRRYKILLPNAEICIGETDIEPYCKADAINNAAKIATRDIFIITDADIVFDIKDMEIAIEGLSLYPWIIPYKSIIRLTAAQTYNVLQQDSAIAMSNIDFSGSKNVPGLVGGNIIVPRKHFEKIGGFDDRFRGWGSEDDAFYMAMTTIIGANARLKTSMWHLYHPTATKIHYQKNCDIFYKYYRNKDTIINDLKSRSII